MAKSKSKRPKPSVPLPGAAKSPPKEEPPRHPSNNAFRETVEALATAFMLAFFIRTFIAEAFVIPTGSMSPALQGAHKDLDCPQCNQRFRVNASVDGRDPGEVCVAGMCPMCRYTVPFSKALADEFPDGPQAAENVPTYNGDRIVVNKFLYSFAEPQRWDVAVFKFPGHATDNYIKRLVGLPNETLRIYQGDLFVGDEKTQTYEQFPIARKPPSTVLAMRQIVHDTYHDAAALNRAGWPLRWSDQTDDASGWTIETDTSQQQTTQRYIATGAPDAWLRYRHILPNGKVWREIERSPQPNLPEPRAKLVGDFNSYNTRVNLEVVRARKQYDADPFQVADENQGIHWVGDLMVEADLEITSSQGELVLEVVEAGHRFQAVVDLATGEAHCQIVPWESDQAVAVGGTATTGLANGGKHSVLFANVDDQLLLWVDNKLVKFSQPTTYDWEALLGDRRDALPQTSENHPGDLAPVGVAARGAQLAIERLRVWRDIYYIAAADPLELPGRSHIVTDFRRRPSVQVLSDPSLWGEFADRGEAIFSLKEDQFFMLGDNSPQSSDSRLWDSPLQRSRDGYASYPGGEYLERDLLIGRAVSVVWPHTWNYVIPGFSDMRLIR